MIEFLKAGKKEADMKYREVSRKPSGAFLGESIVRQGPKLEASPRSAPSRLFVRLKCYG